VRTAALISLILDALGKSWEMFEVPNGFLVGVPDSGSPQMSRALVLKPIGEPGEATGRRISLEYNPRPGREWIEVA
jgi:hypothetical protein